MFDRAALYAKLRLVAPALAKNNSMPKLTKVWFTAAGLFACDGQIALGTTFGEQLDIGVDGQKLIQLLAKSSAEQVQFTLADDNALRIDSGGYTVRMVASDGEDPPFHWPIPENPPTNIHIDGPMAVALKLAEKVVDLKAPKVQGTGVTLERDGNGTLTVYATDSMSLLHARVAELGNMPLRVVIPLACVQQLVRLAPGWLQIADKYVLFNTLGAPREAEVSMYALQIRPKTWMQLDAPLNDYRMPLEWHPIPDGFDALIARAGVFAEKDKDGRKPCMLILDGTHMHLETGGAESEITDALPFEHAPMSVPIDQKLIARFLGRLDRIGATPDSFYMTNADNSIGYMMSAPPGKQ